MNQEHRVQRLRRALLFIVIAIGILCITYLLIHNRVFTIPPPGFNRVLGNIYVVSSANIEDVELWSSSPAVVTAILWDYRCIDAVFLFSIMFLLILSMHIGIDKLSSMEKSNMNTRLCSLEAVIIKYYSRILYIIVFMVSASLMLYSNLLPVNSFSCGYLLALAITIYLLAQWGEHTRGRSITGLLKYYFVALLVLFLIGFITPIIGLANGVKAYYMQNQFKPWARAGWGYSLSFYGLEILYSGSILLYSIIGSIASCIVIASVLYILWKVE